jgi:hypothetical protein
LAGYLLSAQKRGVSPKLELNWQSEGNEDQIGAFLKTKGLATSLDAYLNSNFPASC